MISFQISSRGNKNQLVSGRKKWIPQDDAKREASWRRIRLHWACVKEQDLAGAGGWWRRDHALCKGPNNFREAQHGWGGNKQASTAQVQGTSSKVGDNHAGEMGKKGPWMPRTEWHDQMGWEWESLEISSASNYIKTKSRSGWMQIRMRI